MFLEQRPGERRVFHPSMLNPAGDFVRDAKKKKSAWRDKAYLSWIEIQDEPRPVHPKRRLWILHDSYVHGMFAHQVRRHTVAEFGEIEPSQQRLSRTHQYRRTGKLHFINVPRVKILPDRRCAAAESDILSLRRFESARKSLFNSFRDKVKRCAALHG